MEAHYIRKRARSLSLPPPSPQLSPFLSPLAATTPALGQKHYIPLTRERLALHTSLTESQAHPTSSPVFMAPPPSSSKTTPSAASAPKTKQTDTVDKLAVYGILVCTGKPLPPEIHSFVSALKAGIGSSPGAKHSPNTRKVAQQQNTAMDQTEKDGMNTLRDFLLFPDHESMLGTGIDHYLDRFFLPSDAALAAAWRPLSTPQPDQLHGYLHARHSTGSPAFSTSQERSLLLDPVTSRYHFPFMSAQWKSAIGGQGQYHARLQGARDGAAINNYLGQFYASAGVSHAMTDTVHFSLTIDMQTALLYVHWHEQTADGGTEYYMEVVMQIFLNEQDRVADMRAVLKRVVENAMGPRLHKLRQAADSRGVTTSIFAAQGGKRRHISSNASATTFS